MAGFHPTTGTVLGAGGVLFATLLAGMVAHESSHALVLRLFGIGYDFDWLPSHDGPTLSSPLATVTPRTRPHAGSFGVRLAAVAPLALATPILLVLTGLVPDPLASGDPFLAASTVGWTACALPSPQDFAVFWGDGSVGSGPG